MNPSVNAKPLGTTAGHPGQAPTEATAYHLEAGQLTAEIWDFGGHLVNLTCPDRQGATTNVVMARGDFAAHQGDDRGGYTGATVGRYANRIAKGRFELDGTTHELATNNEANHLHGGIIGFDRYVWTAEPFATETSAGVHLRHTSPDGDQGYPGTVEVETTYTIDTDNKLTMVHTATTDAPTVVNLTNHTYWNLAGAGSIDRHVIRVGAAHYLPVDDTLIPNSSPQPVVGTRFDMRKAAPLNLTDGGYDHCFVLDMFLSAAELVHTISGRRMTVETDQPGMQIYTANHQHPPHTGIALETQAFPDSPNRPDFPSAVLRPGETYTHRTVHSFSTV